MFYRVMTPALESLKMCVVIFYFSCDLALFHVLLEAVDGIHHLVSTARPDTS